MTTCDVTLLNVSDLVQRELVKFLPDGFVISGVTSELLPDPDGVHYIRTIVILEDGHPEPDPPHPQQILPVPVPDLRTTRI